MGKIVNVSKYPDGVDILARELDLPIPAENMEARKNYVKMLVSLFVMY